MITIHPPLDDRFRTNPGKGWMLMMPGPDMAPFADWRWVSLIYHRVCWNSLEPEEGRFTWDDPSWEGGFGPWLAKGIPVGLDVMCANPHGGAYCTPEWVRKAGCKGHFEKRADGDPQSHGKVMDRWVPDYADPIFQEKLAAFLAAMAKRYDANPLVEFVTLRSYAAWGEWYGTEEPDAVLNRMVELHRSLFKQTTLLIPESCPQRWPGVIIPALDSGIGLRKDGVGGPVHPGEHALFDRVYHRAPVMLEFWGSRDYLIEKGWDTLFDKEECIRAWHASRVNMGFPGQARQWVEKEPGFLDRLGSDMGYRFRIREAWFDERPAAAGSDLRRFTFGAWWRNGGLAPHLRPGAICLFLRDVGGIMHLVHEDLNGLKEVVPTGHYKLEYAIDLPASLRAGSYELLLGLEDRYKGRATPIFTDHPSDAAGRISLGTVTLG